ncbi:retention module-containing protein [Campylobacter concisus]|uniref:retention module-containing protein n=1 Tax=Campylobacter concisus TaxID=199 RepID=UPI000CD95BEA|nr:retention module-containing protein [Campylobacter concisus]
MSNEIAVVKSISGEGAKAINNLGETRELHVGDIVYSGEKIVTDDANSKITIATTNGKEATLIGKDSLNLDQNLFGTENSSGKTIASIDDLQKAILSGKDLNALEETAAGGNAGGNASGDGVSLGEARFAEGGHYSNINENFRNLNDSGRNFEAPISSVSGYADGATGADVITPVVPVSVVSIRAGQDAREENAYSFGDSKYLTFDFSLNSALSVTPTTLNLNFSGVRGKDYDDGYYSLDGGLNWFMLTSDQIYLNDPNDIANLKVRYHVLNDYGQTPGYQNEGEMVKDLGADIAAGIKNFGDYRREVSLSITSDNSEILTTSTKSGIIDDDNNFFIDQDVEGINLDTKTGDETLVVTAKIKDSHIREGYYGDNKLMLQGATLDNTMIEMGDKDDVLIKDSELKNGSRINTWAGEDHVVIDNSKIINSTIDVGTSNLYYDPNDRSKVQTIDIINNSVLTKATIYGPSFGGSMSGPGPIKLNLEKGSSAFDTAIYGSSNKDVINIHGNIDATRLGFSNINTSSGNDILNIDSGAIIRNVQIAMQTGNDTLNINNATLINSYISTDGLAGISPIDKDTFNLSNVTIKKGATLYGGLDTDVFNIENVAVSQNGYGGPGTFAFQGGQGSDIFNIKGILDGKFDDVRVGYLSDVITGGNGDDVVNFESGSVVNYSKIYGEWSGEIGNDTFNVKDGAIINNSEIWGMDGNDVINIKSGATLNNTGIYGDDRGNEWSATGNDIVNVEKGAVLNNVSIDGGSGEDTLIVRENNIDFSKVKNFEKLSLGGDVQSDGSIVDSESANLRLSAANVKDILRDTGKTVLKIDGDSSDRLELDGFDEHSAVSAGGYTKYASLDGTISIEIKDEVVSSF